MYTHITSLPLLQAGSCVVVCEWCECSNRANWQQERHTRENAATTGTGHYRRLAVVPVHERLAGHHIQATGLKKA